MKKLILGAAIMLGIIPALPAQQITSAEYFFDTDPGPGNGIPVSITTPADTVSLQFSPGTAGLTSGIHRFSFRTKDSQGSWSLQMARTFYVNPPPPPPNRQIALAEYFFDTDPGPGNGTLLTISTPADTVLLQSAINTSGLPAGPHQFCMRTRNVQGEWSLLQSRLFYVNPSPSSPNQQVMQAEYFYDTDPGPGNGTPLLIPQGDTVSTAFNLSNPFTNGSHYFILRTKDNDGNWSLQSSKRFTVCSHFGANSDFTSFNDRRTVYFNNISQFDTAFTWNFGDATSTSLQRNPVHLYAIAGIYPVSLISYNACATDTFTVPVTVNGIQSIFPGYSADTNFFVGHIRGLGFQPGCVIKLNRGATTLIADSTIFISSTDLKVIFKFNHDPQGAYHVIAQNPSGILDTLRNAFQLQPIRAVSFSMGYSGRAFARTGRHSIHKLSITNDGNTTVFMVPVFLTYVDSPSVHIRLSNGMWVDPASDPQILALVPPDHAYPTDDPFLPGLPPQKMIAAVVTHLAPGETAEIVVDIQATVPQCVNVEAVVGLPLATTFNDPLGAGGCNLFNHRINCALTSIGLIPVVGCAVGAFKFGCNVGTLIDDAIWGTNKGSFMDLFANLGSSIISCVAPVANPAQAYALAGKVVSKLKTGAGLYDCLTTNFHPYPLQNEFPKETFSVCYGNSFDPNGKYGPKGISPDNYVSKYAALPYQLTFENEDTASAPAAEVHIIDRLDTSRLDLSTFHFTHFGFGDTLFLAPDEYASEWVQDIDLRSTQDIWLRVHGKLDTETGMLDWKFTSYDTTTFDVVTDPALGFLPPNVTSPEGEGFIAYAVTPKLSLLHGDVISADSAEIIFDDNVPVLTNDWVNTVDTIKPSSSIQPLSVTQDDSSFVIHLNGSDAHAGVMDYIVYASVNDSDFKPFIFGLPYDSIYFTGVNGWQYEFFSQARDRVMNLEDTVHAPDAVTVIAVGVDELAPHASVQVFPNPTQAALNILVQTEKKTTWKATLYTLEGKRSGTFELKSNEKNTIPLTFLVTGLYYLKIENEDKQFLIKKIIVIK